MNMKRYDINRKFITAVILTAVSLILVKAAISFPKTAERIYSAGIYPLIGQILSSITGILPFSLGEFTVIAFAVLVPLWLLYRLFQIILGKGRYSRLYEVLRLFSNLAVGAAGIFFAFVILWGLNYYRLPFAQLAGLEVKPASVTELASLCERLIDETNAARALISEDANGIMRLNGNLSDMFKRTSKGYNNHSMYPFLTGTFGKPKPVLLSEAMCYTGISGIYFPFTGEANVNIRQPVSMLPCTACHEMAHQRGFAREDEANYIAYIACIANPDKDFQYSGKLLALIYSMNALRDHDPDRFAQLTRSYSDGLRRDLTAINQFWKKYEGPVEKVQDRINNAYLKANNQKDGVYSYGRMVDLLLAEQRQKTGQ